MFTPLLTLLAAFSALAAPLNSLEARAETPCSALIGNATVFPPSLVRACLRSVPFNPRVRTNIMAAVSAIYTLDIFEYNQLGDNDSVLSQNVDIQKEFARINTTSYSSDYDFQSDLSQVLNSLNDGHHYWTSCYQSAFSTSHVFPIIAAAPSNNSTDTKIYLAPDLPIFAAGRGLTETFARGGVNLSALAGAEVTQINNRSTWDYLYNVELGRVGQYQDPQQRLNSLFARYSSTAGVFLRTGGAFTTTQDLSRDNITLGVKLANGTERTIVTSWYTAYSGSSFNFTSGEAFFNATCLSSAQRAATPTSSSTTSGTPAQTQSAPSSAPASASSSTSQPSLAQIAAELYSACPITTGRPTFPIGSYSPTNRSSAYLGGRDAQFYVLPQNRTGVVFIPTFNPQPSTNTACLDRFQIDLILGLQNFSRAGVSNILIDTSNNGGGSVQLNQAAQRLFTGQQFLEESNFQSVLRKSPLSEALLAATLQANNGTLYRPARYRNGTSLLPNNTNFFQPGLQRSINGRTLYTSNLLEDSISSIEMVDMAFNISDAAPYPPNKIVFTGNGLCGSACSSFTNFLIEYYNATAYIASAQPSNPIEFQAFAAGQAISSSDLYQDAAAARFNDTSLLPPLSVIGTLGFAFRASISPNIAPGDFLQYRPFPAQRRYAITPQAYLDPFVQWQYVASQVFP